MKKARERAAAMFETLAVLHLHALTPQGQRGETSPQIDRVLSGLQRMSKEEWSDFLRLRGTATRIPSHVAAPREMECGDAVGPLPSAFRN